jgi:hypothetical protein
MSKSRSWISPEPVAGRTPMGADVDLGRTPASGFNVDRRAGFVADNPLSIGLATSSVVSSDGSNHTFGHNSGNVYLGLKTEDFELGANL